MIDVDVIIKKRGCANEGMRLNLGEVAELRDKLNCFLSSRPQPRSITFNIDIKTPKNIEEILKELLD